MPSRRPPSDRDLERAARRLGRALVQRRWQMASAESCTGGLVGHVITGIPRASDHYLGGVISYSNLLKEQLLGVDHDLLEEVGAVSPEVAEAMADGILRTFDVAALAVAVTGIAGPDGGSAEKPVGLTYVAATVRGGGARIERAVWTHDRDGNKRASALLALELAHAMATG
jgi:PncC family amidohydrolase